MRCKSCGVAITEGELCSYGCPEDATPISERAETPVRHETENTPTAEAVKRETTDRLSGITITLSQKHATMFLGSLIERFTDLDIALVDPLKLEGPLEQPTVIIHISDPDAVLFDAALKIAGQQTKGQTDV